MHHVTRQWAGRMGNRGGRRGGRNITFNAVAPGPFPGCSTTRSRTRKSRDAIAGATSVGRVGTPEDMAGGVHLPGEPRRRVRDRGPGAGGWRGAGQPRRELVGDVLVASRVETMQGPPRADAWAAPVRPVRLVPTRAPGDNAPGTPAPPTASRSCRLKMTLVAAPSIATRSSALRISWPITKLLLRIETAA